MRYLLKINAPKTLVEYAVQVIAALEALHNVLLEIGQLIKVAMFARLILGIHSLLGHLDLFLPRTLLHIVCKG